MRIVDALAAWSICAPFQLGIERHRTDRRDAEPQIKPQRRIVAGSASADRVRQACRLKPGMRFKVDIHETDKKYTAKVVRLSGRAVIARPDILARSQGAGRSARPPRD
jgi:hypothetical protein